MDFNAASVQLIGGKYRAQKEPITLYIDTSNDIILNSDCILGYIAQRRQFRST